MNRCIEHWDWMNCMPTLVGAVERGCSEDQALELMRLAQSAHADEIELMRLVP